MRRRTHSNTPIIIASVISVSLILVAVLIAVNQGKPHSPTTEPQATKQGKPEKAAANYDQWNHKDLIAYLNTKGLRCKWQNTKLGAFQRPAILLRINGDEENLGDWEYVWKHTDLDDHQIIMVGLYDSKRTASDKAGASPHSRSWERFMFTGDERELSQIFAVLPK